MIGKFALSALGCLVLSTLCLGRPPVVVIDPGHLTTPKDLGVKGKKLYELQANFHVAALLARMLETQGVKVILTRPDVRLMVTTKRRAQIANWAKAALFLRIHCDQTSGSGFAVVYPNEMGVATDGAKGPPASVLASSYTAAKLFHAAMALALKGELADNGIIPDAKTVVGAKQGALTGSIYSNVPTLLVDMVVLTNPQDEAWFSKYKNIPKMVTAIDKGVLAAISMDEQ